jgi:hypothetical protein
MLDKTKMTEAVVISRPNFQEAVIRLNGVTPYCSNKMSSENRRKMMEKQESGDGLRFDFTTDKPNTGKAEENSQQ